MYWEGGSRRFNGEKKGAPGLVRVMLTRTVFSAGGLDITRFGINSPDIWGTTAKKPGISGFENV